MSPSHQAPRPRRRQSKPSSSSSTNPSPVEPATRRSSLVAFVQVDAGTVGVSSEARRAVRVQAAKSSADARKKTIARKLALKRGKSDADADADAADVKRRFSLPSPLVIDPETAISSASASVTSSPTLSLRQHPAPSFSWNYPTPLQYAEVQAVVEYFLAFFAPDVGASRDLRGREFLREELWPWALTNQSLFHSCLLVAGSHAAVTGWLQVPMEMLSQAKHIALASINNGVLKSLPGEHVPEPIIAAIALLGGWELEYGDPAVYDTHMRGLQTIIDLRGGLYPTGDAASPHLSPTTVTFVLSIAHNLALYAQREPYFPNPEYNLPTLPIWAPAELSEGLFKLIDLQLLPGALLRHVGLLNAIDMQAPEAMSKLEEVYTDMSGWSSARLHLTWFSPLQTDFEDRLNSQVQKLIRLAVLTLSRRLQRSLDHTLPELATSPQEEMQKVRPEELVNTVYNEITFWALFTVCVATDRWDAQQIRVLKRLQTDLQVDSWEALNTRLAAYVHPGPTLNPNTWTLWDMTMSSSAALINDSAFDLAEPTRYAKGIHHPTHQIGMAIAANELQNTIEIPTILDGSS